MAAAASDFAMHAEASNAPSGLAAAQYSESPWPYSLKDSSHNVFCKAGRGVGGGGELMTAMTG
jgi:hypothetical protein